jgi:hypothetical protein
MPISIGVGLYSLFEKKNTCPSTLKTKKQKKKKKKRERERQKKCFYKNFFILFFLKKETGGPT